MTNSPATANEQHRSDDVGPLVCIAIPAYRSERLEDCLASLASVGGDGVPFEVRIVLNDATDDVKRIAKTHESPAVHVIDMPMNLGIAGGINLGFASSQAPFLLGLQDDATVQPGWIRNLVDRIGSAPDVGAVGCLTLDPAGRVWDAGWIVWSDGITSPVWMNASRDPRDYTEGRAIAQHASAGLLIRREAWESIGGFDDAFYPAYYSDVDVCVSLRRRGWRILYEPRSAMFHASESTSTPPYQQFLLERNRQVFVEKHREFLATMPTRSDDPDAIAEVARRIAATPPGPAPAPPTEQELETLATRLNRTPEEVLRWERDVLFAFARSLESRLQKSDQHASQIERDLLGLDQRIEAALSALTAERQRTSRLAADYHSIANSRSWRYGAPLRWARRTLL